MAWLKELFNSISKVETSYAQTFPKDVFREPKVPVFKISCVRMGEETVNVIYIPLPGLEEQGVDIDELKACLAGDQGWILELCAMAKVIIDLKKYIEDMGCIIGTDGNCDPADNADDPCLTYCNILDDLNEAYRDKIIERITACALEQIEPMGPKLPPGYVEIGT